MNMHRLDTLQDTADSDYNVGTALAAEGKMVSHVQTMEQLQGYKDYIELTEEEHQSIMSDIRVRQQSYKLVLEPKHMGYLDAEEDSAFCPEYYYINKGDQYEYAQGFSMRKPKCRIAVDFMTAYKEHAPTWQEEDYDEAIKELTDLRNEYLSSITSGW